jgi:hypothetical protein
MTSKDLQIGRFGRDGEKIGRCVEEEPSKLEITGTVEYEFTDGTHKRFPFFRQPEEVSYAEGRRAFGVAGKG